MANRIEALGTQQVIVHETAAQVIEVVAPAQPAVVEVTTTGPQGPAGVTTLGTLEDVNTSAKVNQSVLDYDASSGLWRGDDINTITTITDGGSF